jgi:hypothetical protein
VCNIYFHDESNHDWAVETWHTLKAAPAKAPGDDERDAEE